MSVALPVRPRRGTGAMVARNRRGASRPTAAAVGLGGVHGVAVRAVGVAAVALFAVATIAPTARAQQGRFLDYPVQWWYAPSVGYDQPCPCDSPMTCMGSQWNQGSSAHHMWFCATWDLPSYTATVFQDFHPTTGGCPGGYTRMDSSDDGAPLDMNWGQSGPPGEPAAHARDTRVLLRAAVRRAQPALARYG